MSRLLPQGMHWTCLLLVIGILAGTLAGLDQPAAGAEDTGVVKQIIVRLADGRPAPALTVTLAAVPDDPAPQTTRTDAMGQARFARLPLGLWRVAVAGQVDGRMVQPVAAQGRPPYGTDPAGGGFLVPVEPQLEDAAPTPVLVGGTPQPEVQPSGLVLLPAGSDEWAVTLDLAGAADLPQPLVPLPSALLTALPTVSPRVTVSISPVNQGAGDPTVDTPNAAPWMVVLLVMGCVVGLGLVAYGRQRAQ